METCCKNDMTEKWAALDSFIESHGADEGALIATLHKAQEIFDYLPEEVQVHVARKLGVPDSKVYGVVTFYSFFNMKKKGKLRVSICTGTACFVRGADAVVEAFKKELDCEPGTTSEDEQFSLDCLRCVGACGLAPVVTVNGQVYGRVNPDDVKGIIKENVEKGEVA